MSLAAQQVSQRLGGQTVLDGVNVAAPRGQLTAIIGPNGAGKSTLLRLLAGLDVPSSGEVRLDATPLAHFSRRERAARLSFLAQSEPLPPDALVQEVVTLGLGAGGWLGGLLSLGAVSPPEEVAVSRVLTDLHLQHLAQRRIHDLSGGEVQRVALARALVATPHYLLLDEPTNHLDIGYAVALLEQLASLAAGGLGVVTVLHDLNLAARADQVWLLHQGQVVAAGPPEVVLTAAHLQAVYGLQAEVIRHAGRLVVVPL